MSNNLTKVDDLLGLDAKNGIYMGSDEGGISLVCPGKDSFFVMETKNLAILKAGDNSVSIYDDEVNGGMVDIQADAKGAVNLAVQEGAKQNTALTITNGDTHLGVFGTGQFNRVHVEKDKVKIESSAGAANLAAKELGMVEVTPTKVTIKCLESIMEVDVNGFNFVNATKTFEMHLNTSNFIVKSTAGQELKMDLKTGNLSIKSITIENESIADYVIKVVEEKLNIKPGGIDLNGLAEIKTEVEAFKISQETMHKNHTKAISDLKAALSIRP